MRRRSTAIRIAKYPAMTPSFSLNPSALRRLGLALLLAAGFATSAAAEPLVSVEWLNAHRSEPNLVVLDVRSAIDGGGTEAYLAAHIPGSVHSDYDKGGWRVTVHNVPFMLPSAARDGRI